MRPIPPQAVTLVARWEGFEPTAYLDVVGVPTIGYGTIKGVTREDVGKRTITKAQAKAFLKSDMEEAANDLAARIGPVVDELTENQYSALLSLVYNVGGKNAKWSIWSALRARHWEQIPAKILAFNKAGGKKVQGLVNRRLDEVALWSKDEPGTADIVLTSAQTRNMPTPPTVVDPVPPQKSATVWAAITAPIIGFFSMVSQWIDSAPDLIKRSIAAIDPFSDKSPVVANAVMGLSTFAAALGLYVAWKTIAKKTEARS